MPSTVASQPQAERNEILALLASGRGYEFLVRADAHLRACPDDSLIRLMAAREYLKLGFVLPACEILETSAGHDLRDEIASVRESIARIEQAPLSLEKLRDCFERNLGAMHNQSWAAEIRDHWEAQKHDYQILRDRNGQYQLRTRENDRGWRWFPFLGHHQAVDAARQLPDGIDESISGPFLFEGVGLGGYFERVYARTLKTFLGHSCALYVVEPRPANLAAALHLRDFGVILADERVRWFLGGAWSQQLDAAWQSDPDLPFPKQVVMLNGRPREDGPLSADIVESAMESRQKAIESSQQELEQRYRARDIAYWTKRFSQALDGTGPSLRAVAVVSTHTTFLKHSMRDIKRAFESCGHQLNVLSETAPFKRVSPLRYHQAIRDGDADLFFCIDHVRPEFGELIPGNLPILTWDQDQLPHVITRENLSRLARHDFLVGCSKLRCITLGANARQLMSAAVPTCPEQFSGPPITDAERSQFVCDVSYVSHASQTSREFHDQERRTYPQPELQRLLDVAYELLPEAMIDARVPSGPVAGAVLRKACEKCNIHGLNDELQSRMCGWYLWRLGDRIFRHQALEWVACWARRTGRDFRIYGNGWEKHPTLAQFAAGPAANGRELLCIYRASRINLQLMPAGFIHQRALDGLAAGGFFMTRLVPIDLRGRILRDLLSRMNELGIRDQISLAASSDQILRTLIRDYLGGLDAQSWNAGVDLYSYLVVAAEQPHPDELFPQFREIAFDSAAEFENKANAFLAEAPQRAAIAQQMREVVVRRLTYRVAMDRFLRGMANYLRAAAEPSTLDSPPAMSHNPLHGVATG